jgi:hypothetical protein
MFSPLTMQKSIANSSRTFPRFSSIARRPAGPKTSAMKKIFS